MIDVVAIYDQNFRQMFELARPIKATVKEASKLMEHPLETGAVVTDFSIILPVEIELSIIASGAEYKSTYQRLRQSFRNRELLAVQTNTGLYESMLIQSLPHEEDPALFDAITIALSLKEVQLIEAQYAKLTVTKVRNPVHASTVNKGQQQPKDTTSARGSSILYGVFN